MTAIPERLLLKLAGLPPQERAEKEREWRELSEADEDCRQLAALERLNDLVRDRVLGVAKRYQTAVYLNGRAGTGKTRLVRETLDGLGADAGWVYRNARLSPAALFELFAEYADHTIVLDDVPLLFGNKQGVQLLLAALGGDPGRPRTVTYSTKGDHRRTVFRGGLIAVSNLPLKSDPLAAAVKSRAVVLSHEPTDRMLIARMRSLARSGYKGLAPADCREVAEFVIGEVRRSDYRFDLRYYGKAVEDFLYCRQTPARSDWRDLVQSSLQTMADPGDGQPGYTRAATAADLRHIAIELAARYPNPTPAQVEERNREWVRRTGRSAHTYYRKLRELGYQEGRPPVPPAEPATSAAAAPLPGPPTPADD